MPDQDAPLVRNATIHIAGEALWGLGSATLAPATVLMTFLSSRGGEQGTAGLLAAIEGGAGLLQIAGPYLFRTAHRRKRQILLWHFCCILPAMYLMGWAVASGAELSTTWVRVMVLTGCALFFGSIGMVAGMWGDWFAHLFAARVRGTISGLVWCATALAGALGGFSASRLIATHHYGWLALLACSMCTLSISLFGWVRDPADAVTTQVSFPRGHELLKRLLLSWRSPPVRALLVARICGNAAFAVIPFVSLRFLQLGFSDSSVVACGIGLTVGSAVAALTFGPIGDRWGHRLSLRAGLIAAAGALLIATTSTSLTGCILTYAALGLGGGAWLGGGYLVHETNPHDSRLSHLIACNLVQAAAGIVVPLLWVVLAKEMGLQHLEALGLGVALIGLVWAWFLVPEPRLNSERPNASC